MEENIAILFVQLLKSKSAYLNVASPYFEAMLIARCITLRPSSPATEFAVPHWPLRTRPHFSWRILQQQLNISLMKYENLTNFMHCLVVFIQRWLLKKIIATGDYLNSDYGWENSYAI